MASTTSNPRKPIFDAVRSLLRRGFRQHEVDALDAAFDRSQEGQFGRGHERGTGDPYLSENPTQISPAGIALIKRFEGCARLRPDGLVEAYPDPGTGGDPWTIGWGATGRSQTGPIGPGTVWTQEECDTRLAKDLKRYAADVARAIGDTPTTQPQFDAMVSFHYNTGAIGRATLTKKHKAGDYVGASSEFARWNKAGGRVLKGLVRRRAAEAELYASQ